MKEYLKYPIEIFWSDEDECYIANVPDFRYCSAHGETQEEALKEIKIAMQVWVETVKKKGEKLPVPSKQIAA